MLILYDVIGILVDLVGYYFNKLVIILFYFFYICIFVYINDWFLYLSRKKKEKEFNVSLYLYIFFLGVCEYVDVFINLEMEYFEGWR